MALALSLAREAAAAGEVPVGAVVVDANGRLLAAAANRTEAARQFDVGTAQRGSQFDQQLGFNRDQFAKDFGLRSDQFAEGKRQFDATQQFAGEQARADRNARRQVAGVQDAPAPIPSGFRFTQPANEDGTPRGTMSMQDMQMQSLLRAIQQLGQRPAA